MDDRDQAWVDEKRRSYQPRKKTGGRNMSSSGEFKGVKLPSSDAVLNCPACLTTLTRDCQRHEIYHNQYRAMFVTNCVIDFTQKLSFPNKEDKKNFFKNKRKNKNKSSENNVGQMFLNNVPLVSIDQNKDVKKDENKVAENANTKTEFSGENSSDMNGVNIPTTQTRTSTESIVTMEPESSENNNILNQECKLSSEEISNIKGEPSDKNSSNTNCINMPTIKTENVTESIVAMETESSENINTLNQEENKSSCDDNSITQQSSQSKLTDTSEWYPANDTAASIKKKSKLVNTPAFREKASKDSVFGSLREVYMQPSSSNISTSGSHANRRRETPNFFHPVSCTICKTKVAVYDNDEVYHFFNSITSY
ncbi:unnamed protein product [Meganyctiphanes norvegica]|uniref:E2F-associated phosphoprotein n=1 Tax=Meganyctiphanes norvegica TaxID=48144 RepID=A0AAV2RJ14_MEGNR